ncbi:hypothetical protein Tco_0656748 [Tanacetum coccineum]|uniref:Retrovirus-related Pol polyprotein from transposon TNT 1-94-like beta-barrel domain-containing protein n=1 Tax=Tanacetum coccineum TaxID=301880 RepID=A0ABQ4X9R3_9ASTR
MNKRRSEADRIFDFKALDFQNLELTEKVTALQEQNAHFRAKNEKVKQHYKELYDSIKITSKVLSPGMYAIDVEPISPHNRNKREVHLDYLKHLKESIETLHEIVEEARIEKPLENALGSACFYTKRSQELLEYVIGTCPKEFNQRDKKVATTPLNRKKQVTFKETCGTLNDNTQKHVKPQKEQKTNVPVIPSTGVISSTEASGSKPRRNTKNTRILPAKSDNKKKVEDHPRNNKSNLKQKNRVDSSISSKYKCRNKQDKAISTSIPTTAETQTIDTSVKYTAVVQIVLWHLDSGCSKHMMGNRSRLKNFVKKFIGTVRFENDHFGAIIGYRDYKIGDSVISRVEFFEGWKPFASPIGCGGSDVGIAK